MIKETPAWVGAGAISGLGGRGKQAHGVYWGRHGMAGLMTTQPGSPAIQPQMLRTAARAGSPSSEASSHSPTPCSMLTAQSTSEGSGFLICGGRRGRCRMGPRGRASISAVTSNAIQDAHGPTHDAHPMPRVHAACTWCAQACFMPASQCSPQPRQVIALLTSHSSCSRQSKMTVSGTASARHSSASRLQMARRLTPSSAAAGWVDEGRGREGL